MELLGTKHRSSNFQSRVTLPQEDIFQQMTFISADLTKEI